MNATDPPPHQHTPHTLHTLSIGDTQGMTTKYVMLSHRHARHVRMKIPCLPHEEKKAPRYRKKNQGERGEV